MARAWTGKCTRCDEVIRESDQLRRRAVSLGKPPAILCSSCQRLEAHGLKTTAVSQMLVSAEAVPSTAPLGRIEVTGAEYRVDERPSAMVRDQFGVSDQEIQALYDELRRDDTPVVIAVAPTGSGKSTFLPYRLLVPHGLPLDTFTKGRQIVITQPRRGATIGIAGYVSGTLHGADVGVGHEIGYRVSGDVQCDWRNRLVYVTDGTLITWIVRGELERMSLIVIDEAHERSLNIDVILGLITRCLPQYPHLKLLIVSATIDHEKFRKYFESHLPANQRCGVVNCSGTKPVGLTVHYRDEACGTLPYAKGPLRDFGSDVARHLADAIVRLVVAMESKAPTAPRLEVGDVLGFLHGSKPIQEAVDRIKDRLQSEYPGFGSRTDVYPLFAAVDEKTRRLAIDKKKDPSRRRIVIASNAAETSLTIDGLVHVIDSGFIKETQWDPVIEQAPLLPIAHSQAGCRQRWGRVGRTAEGFAWCLYSKDQFARIFGRDTRPEIQRACLDGVVLSAKRAGADRLDQASFPWLDAPSAAEIESSMLRLRRQGAIDQDGDLTEAGVEIALSGGEDALYTRLIADGDRFGFGIEVATLLPYVKDGFRDLFPEDRSWEPEKARAIRAAQHRVRSACADDLELCLRVFQASSRSPDWAGRNGADLAVIKTASTARADTIRQLGAKKKELEDREIDFAGLDRLRALMARAFPEQVYVRVADEGDEARYQSVAAGDEDRPLLGIDFGSACRDQPPAALIALGPKRPGGSRRGPDASPVVFCHFAVAIELEVFEAVLALNDLELANYFRERMPRPLRGSERDRRQRIGQALREEYPVGALVECRVRAVTDTGLDVQVLRSVGWAGKPIPSVVSSGRKENQADKKERDFDFRFAAPKAKPKPAQAIDETVDLVAEAIDADADADTRDVPDAGSAGQRPGPGQTNGREAVTGRLRAFGNLRTFRPGDVVRAEVTQYSELSSLPELLLVTPPTPERFRAFQERHRVGQAVDVEVIGHATGVDRLSGLTVRERTTGVEALVPAAEMVLFSRPALLRAIPIGARFPLQIVAIDSEALEVSLSGLPWLEPHLASLRGRNGATHPSRIVAAENDERNVYLHVVLESSAPDKGVILAAKVVMHRERFEIAGNLRLPAIGERVHVKIRDNGRSTSRTGLSRLTPAETSALGRANVAVDGDRLVTERPLPLAVCAELAQGSSSRELRAAVRELHVASNLLLGDRIVTDLEERFPRGAVVSGTVTWIAHGGLTVTLEGGIKGLISVQEISWWTTKPLLREFVKVGDVRDLIVLGVESENQIVRLSLKQVIDDPWQGGIKQMYPEGRAVRGAVKAIHPYGAFVRLEPGLDGLIHKSGMRKFHGRFVEDPSHVVQEGDLVIVTIKEIDFSRKAIGLELVRRAGRAEEEPAPARATESAGAADDVDWDAPRMALDGR